MSSSGSRAGRPKASSRETLAEAACELFLERGYDATSVADITQRAGVSRSSFFNYFASKSDVLWSGLDARIAQASDALAALDRDGDADRVRGILREIVRDFAPDPLALALRNRSAMGLDDELVRDTGVRQIRLASAISDAARAAGMSTIHADIVGAAHAAALFSSLRVWAEQGAGFGAPETMLDGALRGIDDLRWK
ncbi:HTH-type transcriptional regulator EthR [Microbacterium hydrocarbonoxydans]|jgi:AcrR family transcriptional regulator|uniref:HTH-type transcriptional regulator EthR n=1 Tax=Microbacterium hydrocarbonoxydans TaxID=273678 RepID=A0A0M2HPV3_9MICO|nr:TetR/AcrR family transcriptional regulator [Microbacterium hydrocarbonoxydans]KJL46517.1 HTH-type transcriptional regulator EthR [Microbacterium hydrocarbonoxydans]